MYIVITLSLLILPSSALNCPLDAKDFEVTSFTLTDDELWQHYSSIEATVRNTAHTCQSADIARRKDIDGGATVSLFTQDFRDRKKLLKVLKRKFNIRNVHTYKMEDAKMGESTGTTFYRRSANEEYDASFDLDAYHTFDEIMEHLNRLSSLYPEELTLHNLGETVENRSIVLVQIADKRTDEPKPRIYMDGGQHAREWISPAVVIYAIHQLLRALADKANPLHNLITRYEFHLVPVLNPDGYEFTYAATGDRFWRKNRKDRPDKFNCTGVDLNRNFDFHWSGPGSSGSQCSEVYRGPTASSEEETAAISNYILQRAGWHTFLSLHSYGQMILFPYSHTQIPGLDHDKHMLAGKRLADGILQVNGREYITGAASILLYEASGSSESWAYGVAGFPYAYTIELPDKKTFMITPDHIAPTTIELLNGLVAYLQHIEECEPYLYSDLVQNITQQRSTINYAESSTTVANTESRETTRRAISTNGPKVTFNRSLDDIITSTTALAYVNSTITIANMTTRDNCQLLTMKYMNTNQSCKTTSSPLLVFNSTTFIFVLHYLSSFISFL